MNLLNNTLLVWAQHREFRAVYSELSRRSDRELRALGLVRGDLAATAYAEAERRIVTPAPNRAEAAALGVARPCAGAGVVSGAMPLLPTGGAR